MICYENLATIDIIDVLETFAYRILHYEHPTWHSIPEKDVVQLLREESIDAYLEEDK